MDTTQLDQVITLILYITTIHSFTVLCSGNLHAFGKNIMAFTKQCTIKFYYSSSEVLKLL